MRIPPKYYIEQLSIKKGKLDVASFLYLLLPCSLDHMKVRRSRTQIPGKNLVGHLNKLFVVITKIDFFIVMAQIDNRLVCWEAV